MLQFSSEGGPTISTLKLEEAEPESHKNHSNELEAPLSERAAEEGYEEDVFSDSPDKRVQFEISKFPIIIYFRSISIFFVKQ